MSKYVQFILVTLYAILTITALYLFVYLIGRGRIDLEDWMVFLIMGGWLIICFSTPFWYTNIFFLFEQVRKPILEEEQRLLVSLYEVQKRAKDKNNYRLRIAEGPGLNAYAIGYNTIVVSKDCINLLTEEELSALLAHEMGHLRTKDCIAGMAFYFTNLLPAYIARFLPAGLQFSGNRIKAVLRQGLMFALIVLIILLVVLSKTAVMYYLMAVVSLIVCLWVLNISFNFLALINSRFTEYRQDEFASSIGFGPALKQVLVKFLNSSRISPVDRFFILTRSTHPIMHNRIRRLEKLSGLRK